MIDRLIEIGRCYGMKMNVEKTKVIKISRQPTLLAVDLSSDRLQMMMKPGGTYSNYCLFSDPHKTLCVHSTHSVYREGSSVSALL
jgi:hypothetical protein